MNAPDVNSNSAAYPKRIYIPNTQECVLASEQGGFEERLKTAIGDNVETVLTDDPRDADVIVINQVWKGRNWNDIALLESCGFVRQFAEKILVISHDSNAVIFFPGLYVSLTPATNWVGWTIPSGYKKQYRQPDTISDSKRAAMKRLLFSFRGADFSHPLRRKMTACLASKLDDARYTVVNKKFHSHTAEDHESYVKEMLASHFVLCPRGLSPSSYRMYESMQYGVCPVIISDDWQPVTGIDWDGCSIWIAEKDIAGIPEILRSRLAESNAFGLAARRAWEANFSDGAREQRMLADLLSLDSEISRTRAFHRLQRLWRSREFRRAHGWTFPQRLRRKAQNSARSFGNYLRREQT